MKLARKYILPILIAISCMLFGAGLFGISAKTAKAESTFTLAGASIRYVSSVGNDQGIRFVANANKAEFNSLASSNSNLSVKVIIASLSNLKNASIDPTALDIDTAVFKHTISIYEKEDGVVKMDRWTRDEDNPYTTDIDESTMLTANVYIWKIPESSFQLFWVARMYYTTGAETGHSDNIINKSMSEVALDNYDQATPAQQAKLDEFMKNYTVIWYDEDGTTPLKTYTNQKYGTALVAPSVDTRTGYNQVWYKRTGTDGSGNPTWSSTPYNPLTEGEVRSNTQLKLGYELISYTITYDGLSDAPGGAESKTTQTSYNVETATFTINDPTHANNYFLGWTYEGQTTPVYNPTITKGTTGNKTFTANWGDFTKPDNDFVYEGYYGLFEPKAVSGYNVTKSDVTYTSENTSIATVSAHKINAVATGSTTITAKLGNAAHGYRTQTFSVTVKATSDGDDASKVRTMSTDIDRHNNNKDALSVFNYSGDLTLFMGDSFMDERLFFTDFYTSRYTAANAHLLGISSSRASHWRFFVQDYLAYAPKNIVLHIGTNDLFDGSQSNATVVKYVTNIFDIIHEASPLTTIYYWTIEDRYKASDWSKTKESNITAINNDISTYAATCTWVKVVDTRSKLTATADYRTADGSTRVHPSIPTGYDKCMAATVAAGLSITANANAATNIVKDFTTNQDTDIFETSKPMGQQARSKNFVWESDVTLNTYTNNAHIAISFRNDNATANIASGAQNRFLIWNKNSDGKFYYSGHLSGWRTPALTDYITGSAGKTFKLAILVTNKNAYMFVDGALVETFMNPYLYTGTANGAPYYSFRVGTQSCSVTFANNKISNANLNAAIYNEYLNNETVVSCDADTSIETQEMLNREVTFTVYNNAHFSANGLTITLTNTSTSKNYTGIVENNKLKMYTGTAGALVSGTYNVTTEISGRAVKLYSSATVSVSDSAYTINGGNIEFDIFANSYNSGWSTIKDLTSSNSIHVDLATGTLNKINNSANFSTGLLLRTNAFVTPLPSKFYTAVFIKGDVRNIQGGFRFGIVQEKPAPADPSNYSATLMQNPQASKVDTLWGQEVNTWSGFSTYSKARLYDTGYWLVSYYDTTANRRIYYVSDNTCSTLVQRADWTKDVYNYTMVNIGVCIWSSNGNDTHAAETYTMNTTGLRIGESLSDIFNGTVTVSTNTPAGCTASVTEDGASTTYVAKGSSSGVTFKVVPDKGYQVSSVTLNGTDITNSLNCGTYTVTGSVLKDLTFNVTLSNSVDGHTITDGKIDLPDTTITFQGGGIDTAASLLGARLGVSDFTWQGFVGLPSDTPFNLEGYWCLGLYFTFANGKTIELQVGRWGGYYVKVKGTGDIAPGVPSDVSARITADKGLTFRVVVKNNKANVYMLTGEAKDTWRIVALNYDLANGGTYLQGIKCYKSDSSIAPYSSLVKDTSILTYADDPENMVLSDYAKGDNAKIASTKIADIPEYSGNSFWWSGFVGWNVTAGASSELYTTQKTIIHQFEFYDANGQQMFWSQLLHWQGNHIIKAQHVPGAFGDNKNVGYTFYTYNTTFIGTSVEQYYRDNGGIYYGISFDSDTGTIKTYFMDNNNEWWLANTLTATGYGYNKIASIKIKTTDSDDALTGYISNTYVKNALTGSAAGEIIGLSNSIKRAANPASKETDLFNSPFTIEAGYKYHFVNRVSMSNISKENRTYRIENKTLYNVMTQVRYYSAGYYIPAVSMQICNWNGKLYVNGYYNNNTGSNDAKVQMRISEPNDTDAVGNSTVQIYNDWLNGYSITFDIVLYRDEDNHMKTDFYVYDAHGKKYTVGTNNRPYTYQDGVYWDEHPNTAARFRVNGFMMGNDAITAPVLDAYLHSGYALVYRSAD